MCAVDLGGVFSLPLQRAGSRLLPCPRKVAKRWPRQETLGAARSCADAGKIRGVLEADIARLPLGLVLRVGAVEGLQLPVAAGEHQCLPP